MTHIRMQRSFLCIIKIIILNFVFDLLNFQFEHNILFFKHSGFSFRGIRIHNFIFNFQIYFSIPWESQQIRGAVIALPRFRNIVHASYPEQICKYTNRTGHEGDYTLGLIQNNYTCNASPASSPLFSFFYLPARLFSKLHDPLKPEPTHQKQILVLAPQSTD